MSDAPGRSQASLHRSPQEEGTPVSADKPGGRSLVLFDLDHTLLDGDSDVLWCDFLIARGVLERSSFAPRNADVETRYRAGTVDVAEFANFYVGTLAGRTRVQWEPLRQQFLRTEIVPRIPRAALELVQRHQDAGDLVLMTTATNRFITELTAGHFKIEHLIATEPEIVDGVFSGQTTGVLNMRAGKVRRLHDWLLEHAYALGQFHSIAYSDSINDLPLLEAVNQPVTVNADSKLAAVARQRGWRTLSVRL